MEEIEDMGKNMHRSMAGHMKNLIAHLLKLKWQIQSTHRGESWRLTIARCRSDIPDLLEDSLNLTNDLHDVAWFEKTWKKAVELAALEINIHCSKFPQEPIWILEQILDSAFFLNKDCIKSTFQAA